MRALVTGACGLLGSHVAAALSRECDVVGIDRHPWWGDVPIELREGDLRDRDFLRAAVADAAPQLLIHCAAMVDVDACEDQPEEAYAYNAEVTRGLARTVAPDCLFVYITTDGVFVGDRPMRSEADLPCPRTVYGRSKLHGEWEVQLATHNHLIVRTNFFGWSSGRKQSSAEWLYSALQEQRAITLFDDFFFTPLYVMDLVERLLQLAERRQRGLFHIVGRDRVSKYEFGLELAQAAGFSCANVKRGSIEDARFRASRPRDMSLDSVRMAQASGWDVPACRGGLHRFIEDRDRTLGARVADLTASMSDAMQQPACALPTEAAPVTPSLGSDP
jgi:dTDP-4-dehydrorhamnose reductase